MTSEPLGKRLRRGFAAFMDRHTRVDPTFTVQVRDPENRVVAEVDKVLYVRCKGGPRS